jgi:hypothetical protein
MAKPNPSWPSRAPERVAERGAGADGAVTPDAHAGADHRVRADHRAGSDFGARADDRARIDRDGVFEPRLRMDVGARGDPADAELCPRSERIGMQAPEQRGVGAVGIQGDEGDGAGWATGREARRDEAGPRTRRRQGVAVAGVIHVGEVRGPGPLQGRGTDEPGVRIGAFRQAGPGGGRDLREGQAGRGGEEDGI